MRLLPTRANGQVAFGHYVWREEAGAYLRGELSVLSLRGSEIAEIVVFRSPEAFAGFDLPERLEP
jgi:RNA polymerase sigma-70 factor (ECF subfamily)